MNKIASAIEDSISRQNGAGSALDFSKHGSERKVNKMSPSDTKIELSNEISEDKAQVSEKVTESIAEDEDEEELKRKRSFLSFGMDRLLGNSNIAKIGRDIQGKKIIVRGFTRQPTLD